MTDLNELRKQRDALDREIAEAERTAADRWNNALDKLNAEIYLLGFQRDIQVDETTRKNVRTLTIGTVSVELGFIEAPWGAWLAVHRGDLHIVFGAAGAAPGLAVMTALLSALLDEGA